MQLAKEHVASLGALTRQSSIFNLIQHRVTLHTDRVSILILCLHILVVFLVGLLILIIAGNNLRTSSLFGPRTLPAWLARSLAVVIILLDVVARGDLALEAE
jgi:hypothetical protein